MKRRHSSEQIVKMLREAEGKIATGTTVEAVCRELGVSEATYYKWRKATGTWRSIRPSGSRTWRRRTGDSRSWWRICRWITRS